jgi:hypothetical protein
MKRRVGWFLVVGVMGLGACRRQAGGDVVVARIGGGPVTATDLARFAQRYGGATGGAGAASQKQPLLDKLIDFQVVVREGRRRGYDRDPQIVALVEQQLFAKVLHDEVDAKVSAASISPDEVARYYAEHASEFGRPEEVRLSQIVVKNATLAQRLAGEARAARRKGDVTADLQGFRALVARHSEHEASKGRGGDVGFVARGRATVIPPAVAEAGFGLGEVGAVSDPVQAPDGYHILKLTERRPASARTLDEVRPLIQQTLVRERRLRATNELTVRLRRELGVEVDDQALAAASLQRSTADGSR